MFDLVDRVCAGLLKFALKVGGVLLGIVSELAASLCNLGLRARADLVKCSGQLSLCGFGFESKLGVCRRCIILELDASSIHLFVKFGATGLQFGF